jgi:predicted lipoprotein with Yx(FWY)xxD motif
MQGGVLTNPAGMTLYTFDKDVADSGKSVCNGECAAKWPPLAASASDTGSGAYTVITRDDGSKQWAYKGKPLYLWFKDQRPGDMTGDGVNNVWRTAKP